MIIIVIYLQGLILPQKLLNERDFDFFGFEYQIYDFASLNIEVNK